MKIFFTHSFAIFFLVSVVACAKDNSSTDYLSKVLNNLEKVETASYYTITETWQHGDTVPVKVDRRYILESDNPSDTTIGSNFAWFDANDITHLKAVYDGNTYKFVNHDNKRIRVNDYSAYRLPF